MAQCHICGRQVEGDEYFVCSDCGEITCNPCGGGDLCNLCIGDEVFMADILDLEGEI